MLHTDTTKYTVILCHYSDNISLLLKAQRMSTIMINFPISLRNRCNMPTNKNELQEKETLENPRNT